MATLPLISTETYVLLVVDMQKDGLDPGGPIYADGGYAVAPNITKLAQAARAAGVRVIHTQHTHQKDLSDFGIAGYFEEPSCIAGTEGRDFVDGMEPHEEDIVVEKRRYSAFHATDLDLKLRGLGASGIFVCGVLTDACVLSTVVDARSRDYKVWMLDDALSGTNPENHRNALEIMSVYFAEITNTQRILNFLAPSSTTPSSS